MTRILVALTTSLVVLLFSCSKKEPPVKVVEITTAQEFKSTLDQINATFGVKGGWHIPAIKKDTEIYVAAIVQVPIEHVGENMEEYRIRIASQEFKPVAMKGYYFDISNGNRDINYQIAHHKNHNLSAFSPQGPFILPPHSKPAEPAILSFVYIVPKTLIPATSAEFFFGEYSANFEIK